MNTFFHVCRINRKTGGYFSFALILIIFIEQFYKNKNNKSKYIR